MVGLYTKATIHLDTNGPPICYYRKRHSEPIFVSRSKKRKIPPEIGTYLCYLLEDATTIVVLQKDEEGNFLFWAGLKVLIERNLAQAPVRNGLVFLSQR